jgi:hypothetical protein
MKHRVRRHGSWAEHDVHYRAVMNIVDPQRCRLMGVVFKRSLKRLNIDPSKAWVNVRARGNGYVMTEGGGGWPLGGQSSYVNQPRVMRLRWNPRWGLRKGVRPWPVWRWKFGVGQFG